MEYNNRPIVLLICFLLIFFFSVNAKRYAVLISAGEATTDDAHENSEYWYDLLLMYSTLIDNGYDHGDVYVLYGEGTDFQSIHPCYQNPYPQDITDFPNHQAKIDSIFNLLSGIMTENDFLFIWWMGHGGRRWISGSGWHLKLLIENTTEEIWDYELASYINQIQNYRRRAISFMTCFSGGIIDDLEGHKSIVLASSKFSQTSESRIICDTYHAEFNYFETSAFHWETPCGICGSVNADDDQNERISFAEAFNYTVPNVILSTPQISDSSGTANLTYLGYYFMNYVNGWNLIGLPVEITNHHYLTIFPQAMPHTLFSFEGTYIEQDSLELGKGYWLKFPTTQVVSFDGFSVDSLSISLREGWNLIAGPSYQLALTDIIDPSGIIIPGTLTAFDSGYYSVDSIKPGCGYWLRANAQGSITLTRNTYKLSTLAKKLQNIPNLEQFPTLQIRDAAGSYQILHFNVQLNNQSMKLSYSLPPLPPAGSFDARFADDYRICETDSGLIRIQSPHYPITINPSNLQVDGGFLYTITEVVSNQKTKILSLREGESIIVSNPLVSALKLGKIKNVSLGFSVYQNYPNPFNPSTEIHFVIPQAQQVEISVYNALGQKVKTLLSRYLKAGNHRINWDGTDAVGNAMGSGVFFYVVQAGKLKVVKKMLLLK